MLSPPEYRILVDQSPVLIWRAGADGLCDWFNERWLAFTGRTLAQEAGNGWAEGVHPDDLERCLATYVSHFGRRLPFEMEYRLRNAAGAYRWILDRGAPFHADAGYFGGYIGSCIDITEQVEARRLVAEAHRREVEQLRQLLPVCMYCHRIHREDGQWSSIDQYMAETLRKPVSHGMCPDCAREQMRNHGLDEADGAGPR